MRSVTGKAFLRPAAVAALALGVLGLVFLSGSLRLGLWADGGPGPGLLPAVAAAAMLLLIALMLLGGLEDDGGFKAGPLVAIALCLAFALIAPRVGILLPTLALIFAWVKLLHRQTWARAALLSLALTAGGLGLFVFLLKVPIPLIAGVL